MKNQVWERWNCYCYNYNLYFLALLFSSNLFYWFLGIKKTIVSLEYAFQNNLSKISENLLICFCDERKTINVLNNCQLIEWFCLTIFLELWNVFFSFRGSQKYAANTRNVLADWIILSIQQWQIHRQLIESCFRFVNGDECSLDKTGYLIASKVN